MKRVFLNFFCFALLTALILNFVLFPAMEKIYLTIFREEILVPHRNIYKGFFHIMTQDLSALAPSRWPEQMEKWRRHFKVEVAIQPMDRSYFFPRELSELSAGKIVMRGDVNIAGNMFYQRIGNSEFALQLGVDPLRQSFLSNNEDIILWSIIFFYLGGPAIIWAYPFWRRLERIRTAAKAFGQGDFATRVKVTKFSALFTISETFNLMAGRIQRLINSQRRLTLAVSRELHLPIARIRRQCETLIDNYQEAPSSQRLDAIQKEIDVLDALIDRLLSYTRFDGNPPRLSTRSYPLIPWLTAIVDYMEPDLAGKHFKLRHRFQSERVEVRFDPKYMGPAVADVLRNAAMYCRCRVKMTAEQQNNDILLHIDDDGPGIAMADRRRIFDPFTRLDTGRHLNPGGFGLSLAIAQRVLECHKGSLTINDSRLGGARFTLKWPASGDR